MLSVTLKGDNRMPQGISEWEDWAECVEALGTDAFARRFLRLLYGLTGAEHLGFFTFSSALQPVLVAAESLTDEPMAAISAEAYLSNAFFRHDPNSSRVASDVSADTTPLVTVMKAEDIPDEVYRETIYERFDLDGRVSILGRRGRQWHAINIFKHRAAGGFDNADVDAVTTRGALLSALAASHIAGRPAEAWSSPTTPPLGYLDSVLSRVSPKLSAREREVCALALQGLTGEGAALEMGVAESTVATLRKRAYAKTGITTLNELFALCLGSVADQPQS